MPGLEQVLTFPLGTLPACEFPTSDHHNQLEMVACSFSTVLDLIIWHSDIDLERPELRETKGANHSKSTPYRSNTFIDPSVTCCGPMAQIAVGTVPL
jgi:hypothetical protein